MTLKVINDGQFLKASRDFPEDNQAMRMELNKAYLDIASNVNTRVIGTFSVTPVVTSNSDPTQGTSYAQPAITGEKWFISGRNQQSLRQVYQITTTIMNAYSFTHGIDFDDVNFFTVIRGIGFDSTSYYPIPYVSTVAAGDQMGIFVDPQKVNLTFGAGSPVIQGALIILEWLSAV